MNPTIQEEIIKDYFPNLRYNSNPIGRKTFILLFKFISTLRNKISHNATIYKYKIVNFSDNKIYQLSNPQNYLNNFQTLKEMYFLFYENEYSQNVTIDFLQYKHSKHF